MSVLCDVLKECFSQLKATILDVWDLTRVDDQSYISICRRGKILSQEQRLPSNKKSFCSALDQIFLFSFVNRCS